MIFDFGLECVGTALPSLQGGFEADAFKAYCATQDLQFTVLGHGIFGEQRPSRAQKELSQKITDGIRPTDIVTGISTCRFGDWETYARILSWLKTDNRDKHRSILSAISWDDLDRRSVGHWRHPPREFRLLLSSLTSENQEDPVRSWIFEHVEQIRRLDPILTGISPESAIAILRRGGFIDLAGHNKSDWGLQQWALARVAEMDILAAREIMGSNRAHIVERLSKVESIDVKEFPEFLALARELDESLLRQCIQMIDLETATRKWPRLLQEQDATIRSRARQVLRVIAEHSEGGLREFAQSVLRDLR